MQTEDRRIRRTRKLLNEAFLNLVTEKSYDEITVHEITERADVGQRTFYRHFASKEELLTEVMKESLVDLRDLLVIPSSSLFTAHESERTHEENGRMLFEFISKQETIFEVLFEGPPIIYQSMLDIARQNTIDVLKSVLDEKASPIPFAIMANHLTTSTFELMKWWLGNGKPYSIEMMGEYLYQMVFKPMRSILNTE